MSIQQVIQHSKNLADISGFGQEPRKELSKILSDMLRPPGKHIPVFCIQIPVFLNYTFLILGTQVRHLN